MRSSQPGAGVNRQRGGTLLGFVVGVLVGLGAALAVAVYITKVPIPFMSKNTPRGADVDAAEAKKNRDWDPNAGLAGRTAPKPEGAAPAAEPAAPPAPAVLAAPSAVPAKPAADPLGDLANSRAKAEPSKPAAQAAVPKPAVAAAPAATGSDPFIYFVQVGAFRTPEDAEQQRAKLSLMGLQARVTERDQSGRVVYRVRLGPFDKKDEAEKAHDKLDQSGIDTVVVRSQR